MASIITHPAIPLAIAAVVGRRLVPWPLLALGVTDAGMGVAFAWPFSNHRTFFSFRPIDAAPISLERFLSPRGWEVLRTELIWVWAPLTALVCVASGIRKVRNT